MARTTISVAQDINVVLRALGVDTPRALVDAVDLDDVVVAASNLARVAYATLYAGVRPEDVERRRGQVALALAGQKATRWRR